jgi:ABC-type phosphate transport system substrate-binding protein
MRLIVTSVTAAAALGLAACGSDSPGSQASTGETASTARSEVGKTRSALRAALATYAAGDAAAAADQVAEAYVSHFEDVERPLAQKDPALKERLEESISSELRAHMKAHRPAGTIAREVGAIAADLDKAEAALR